MNNCRSFDRRLYSKQIVGTEINEVFTAVK